MKQTSLKRDPPSTTPSTRKEARAESIVNAMKCPWVPTCIMLGMLATAAALAGLGAFDLYHHCSDRFHPSTVETSHKAYQIIRKDFPGFLHDQEVSTTILLAL